MSEPLDALQRALDERNSFLDRFEANTEIPDERFAWSVGILFRSVPILVWCRDARACSWELPPDFVESMEASHTSLVRDAFCILREVVANGQDFPESMLPAVMPEIDEIEQHVYAVTHSYDWDSQAARARGLLAEFHRRRSPLVRPTPTAKRQAKGGKGRGRGRPVRTDTAAEDKLYRHWQASGLSQREFLRGRGIPQKEGLKQLNSAGKRVNKPARNNSCQASVN